MVPERQKSKKESAHCPDPITRPVAKTAPQNGVGGWVNWNVSIAQYEVYRPQSISLKRVKEQAYKTVHAGWVRQAGVRLRLILVQKKLGLTTRDR